MSDEEFAPVTPGEMLKDEFLAEYRLSQSRLAKAVGISTNRIAEIVNNRQRITADTALKLGLHFGTSAEFWMNLQSRYDLKMARPHLTPEEADRIKAQRAAQSPARPEMLACADDMIGCRRSENGPPECPKMARFGS